MEELSEQSCAAVLKSVSDPQRELGHQHQGDALLMCLALQQQLA